MPDRKIHLMFDELLKREGIITGQDTSAIHELTETDFYRYIALRQGRMVTRLEENEIKLWMKTTGFFEDKQSLTDYYRVILGHLLCETLWDNFYYSNDLHFLRVSLVTFKSRGFADCIYDQEQVEKAPIQS